MGLNPKQEAIVDTLDASVNVSAGAGTGKTFTLTKRTVAAIEWILEHPEGLCRNKDNSSANINKTAVDVTAINPIERVLEITFTEKAASELKSRVRSELFAVASKTGNKDMLAAALDADNAWISTIHAMCSRILKENALAFGIDPAFKLLSNAESQALLSDAVMDSLDEFKQTSLFADDLLEAFPLEAHGSFGTSIMQMLRALLDKTTYMPDGLDGVARQDFSCSPGELLRELLEATYDLPEGFIADGLNKSELGKCQDYADQLRDAKDSAMQWLDNTREVQTFGDVNFDSSEYINILLTFPSTSNKFGLKSDAADVFNRYRYTYKQVYTTAIGQISLRYIYALLDFAKIVQRRVEAVKSSGATAMDNNDLLRRCASELAKPQNSDIAQHYRDQFAFIMLDEFQDTDKLQMQIVKSLSHDVNSTQGNVEFANLCTVGDMQQSIYRFRGGDIEESLIRRASLADINDAIFDLDANYRSHPAVLNTVETIFSAPGVFGDSFLHLNAGRDAFSEQIDAMFSGIDARMTFDFIHYTSKTKNDPGITTDQARAASAMRIAKHFRRIKDAALASNDPETIKSASSMAILLRTMKHADIYADALRSVGIDSIVTGGSVFAQTQEAFLVSALLNIAANPADETSLFNVVASDLFNVSDKALTTLCFGKAHNGEGQASSGESHEKTYTSRKYVRCASLSQALFNSQNQENSTFELTDSELSCLEHTRSTLINFRQDTTTISSSYALRQLFAKCGYLHRKGAQDGTSIDASDISSVANISKAIQIVEGLEKRTTGPASLAAAFATYLDTEAEAPGTLAMEGSDFVQIMTIHASKGLEFDHIAIADLGNTQPKSPDLVLDNIDGLTYLTMRPPNFAVDETSRKNANTIKGFTFEDDGEDETSDLSLLDTFELKQLVIDSNEATKQSDALRAYCESQDQAELRRIYYVALTRARESALVEFLTRKMPVNNKGEHCAYDGIQADTYYAIMNQYNNGAEVMEPDFKRRDADITTSRVFLTFQNIDNYLNPSNSLEESQIENRIKDEDDTVVPAVKTKIAFPKYADFQDAPKEPINLNRKNLCSYTSLSKYEHFDKSLDEIPTEDDKAPVQESIFKNDISVEHADDALIFPQDIEFSTSEDIQGAAVEGSIHVGTAADDDKACAFGSAFHRLAQLSILKSRGAYPQLPSSSDIAAQVAKNSLNSDDARRLHNALSLWINSSCAHEFFAPGNIEAEVPFCIAIPINNKDDIRHSNLPETFYLEGEIDALHTDGSEAWFIDYKTGGLVNKTQEDLQAKHGFQAQCYAYALLLSGFEKVKATFVRVEQPQSKQASSRSEGSSQDSNSEAGAEPQSITFTFSKDNLNTLREKIIQTYITSVEAHYLQ